MKTCTVLLLLALSMACTPSEPDDRGQAFSITLAELLACNDTATGGEQLRALGRVEYDLRILEPSFEVDATYWADRSGIARIDIFAEGERVFSEGWDGTAGWQLPPGSAEPVATSPEGAAALRHGLEQPGHFWTLQDMPGNGHSVREDLNADRNPRERVVQLTLADGFQSWYWINATTCRVTRKRDFRAFHPDLDPNRAWIETRYNDFRLSNGITRAWRSYSVDLETGDTIASTQVLAIRVPATQ